MEAQDLEGFKAIMPNAIYSKIPMADGGKGTIESMLNLLKGEIVTITSTDALGRLINSDYGLSADGQTAIIEMAAASGLAQLPLTKRDPRFTTSYGTGEIILDALNRGARHLIIGAGGSATNDGGAGMLQALGVRFLDAQNEELPFGGLALRNLASIDLSGLDSRLADAKIEVACNVINPLTGINGTSYLFGAQKGATTQMIEKLDGALKNYAEVIRDQFSIEIDHLSGAGAAGGMGAGIYAFLQGKLKPGIEIMMETAQLGNYMESADLVITGKDCIDPQEKDGKTPMEVARLAKKYDLPVIGLASFYDNKDSVVTNHGIDALFSVINGVVTWEEALKKENLYRNIANTCENIAQLLKHTLLKYKE